MYGELVYRLGKHYSRERKLNPQVEFPYMSGKIADLIDQATLEALPELQGEYVVSYNDGQGTRHLIRVYYEDGTYEAEGMPANPDIFSLSADIELDTDD